MPWVRYAEMVGADREFRLAGYEVYRFGATELQYRGVAEPMLREFFAHLFVAYGVRVA